MGFLFNFHFLEYIHKLRRVAINLACQPYHECHTGKNMATWVKDIAEDWGIFSRLESLVTDSASNMHAMMNFLPSSIQHGDCTIHILQLVIMVGY